MKPTSIALLLITLTLAPACGDSGSDSPGDGDGDGDGDRDGAGDPSGTPDVAAWTSMGGDLHNTYNNRRETTLSVDNVGDLEEAWVFNVTGMATGTASLVDGKIYATSAGGTYRIDAESGEQDWKVRIGATSSLAYADGVVFVHDALAELHALDAETGEELWLAKSDDHKDANGWSSPVVAGDLVIVGTSSNEELSGQPPATFRGGVVAFDRETGDEVWRYHTVDEDHNGATVWSTVAVDEGAQMVIASTGNNYTGEATGTSDALIALDLMTGDELWVSQVTEGDVYTGYAMVSDDTDFGANPILLEAEIDGKKRSLVAAGQKSGTVWAMDRETGDVVWSRELSGSTPLTGGILCNGAFDGERILVAANTGRSEGPGSEDSRGVSTGGSSARLAALDAATGEIVWERQLGALVWNPITVANGVGFVGSENRIEAFDVETGEQLFTAEVEGTIASGAIVEDGWVYFGSGMSYLVGIMGSDFNAFRLPE